MTGRSAGQPGLGMARALEECRAGGMRVPPTHAEEQSPAHSNTGTRVARGMRVPLAESRAPLLFPINPGMNWKSENPTWNRRDDGVELRRCRLGRLSRRRYLRTTAHLAVNRLRRLPAPNQTATPRAAQRLKLGKIFGDEGYQEHEEEPRSHCLLLALYPWWFLLLFNLYAVLATPHLRRRDRQLGQRQRLGRKREHPAGGGGVSGGMLS